MKLFDILKWMNKTVRKYDRYLYLLMLLYAVSDSVFIVSIALVPKFLLSFLSDSQSYDSVITTLIIYAGILLLSKFFSNFAKEYCLARYMKIRLSVIEDNGAMFMRVPYSVIESSEFINLSQKGHTAVKGTEQGFETILNHMMVLSGHLLTCVICFTYVSTYAVYLLALVIAIVFINRYISGKNKEKEKRLHDEMVLENRKAMYYYDVMSDFHYGKEIRLYAFSGFLKKRLGSALKAIRGKKQIIYKNDYRANIILSFLTFIQENIIYLVFVVASLSGLLDIGSFLSYIGLLISFSTAFNALLEDSVQIKYHSSFVKDLIEYRDELYVYQEEEVADSNNIEEYSDWTIEFDHVSFCYPHMKEYAIKDLTFTIHKGEKIALIGLNGAGKTTVIKLLTRLYDVSQGRIMLNGKDIREFSRDHYYKLFATMFQEVFLFAFSLSENIAMVEKPRVHKEKVMKCLEDVGMSQKVHSLKKGLDTSCLKILDADGVQFSGGEEQRFLLARTIYRDAKICVFDEPTAALDPIIEDRIYQDFNRLTMGKTALFITHHLASTRFCDRIFVFKNGSMIENGTHDELMMQQGEYHSLFTLQSKHYAED